MGRFKQIISYLPFICILLIVALFPFQYSAVHRIALYTMAVTYGLDYGVNRRWREWRWSISKVVYIAFCLFSLLTPIWQLFDPLKTNLYPATFNAFSPFFVIGVAGLMGMTDKIRMDYLAWLMLSVCVAICVYMGYHATSDPVSGADWLYSFNWYREKHINTHMVVNLYFNMSVILGALVLLDSSHTRTEKILTALLLLPVLFALLVTEGRVGLLTMVVIVFALMLYSALRSRQWWMAAVIAVFCAGAGIYLANNKRMQQAYQTKNPRIELWKESFRMIQERPLAGYGVCSAREEYVKRVLANDYLKNAYVVAEVEINPDFQCDGVVQYEMMHPHNAVLESWMRYGIVGLLLCLFCLFSPMCMRLGKYQIYLTLCALAFFIQALFESFGNNLQPLFLASMVFLFDCNYRSDIAKTAPTHS